MNTPPLRTHRAASVDASAIEALVEQGFSTVRAFNFLMDAGRVSTLSLYVANIRIVEVR